MYDINTSEKEEEGRVMRGKKQKGGAEGKEAEEEEESRLRGGGT